MLNVKIEDIGAERNIWIRESYLCEKTGIKPEYLRTKGRYKYNHGSTSWKYIQMEGAYYYEYHTIPNYKGLRSQLPIAEVMEAARNPYKGEVLDNYLQSKIGAKISANFKGSLKGIYEFDFNQKNTAEALAYQYAAYELILSVWQKKEFKSYGYETLKAFMKGAMTHLSEKTSLKISNYLAFRRDLKNWAQSADRIEYLISGHYGNKNRAYRLPIEIVNIETGEMVAIDLHEQLYMQLYLNIGYANKEYKRELHKRYVSILDRLGYGSEAMSERSFCLQTAKYKAKIFGSLERDGNKPFTDRYTPYIAANKVMKRNSLFVADGSGSKMAYNAGGKAGIRSLMLLRIYDVASWRIMGYCIYEPKKVTLGKKEYKAESPEHVLEALQMALKNATKAPKEFLSDNANSFTDISDKISKVVGLHRTIAPGNSQANPAEMLQRLTAELARKQTNWRHSGFHATDIDHLPNEDYIDIKELPTFHEAYTQLEELIEEWNTTPGKDGKTPNQRYEAAAENGIDVDARSYRYCFGKQHKVDVAYMRGFVNVEENGIEYQYDIPNYEDNLIIINQKTGYKQGAVVEVFHDGSKADIYADGEYILTASRLAKSHKTYAEADEETMENRAALTTKKDNFVQKAKTQTAEILLNQHGVTYLLDQIEAETEAEDIWLDEPKSYGELLAEGTLGGSVKDRDYERQLLVLKQDINEDIDEGYETF